MELNEISLVISKDVLVEYTASSYQLERLNDRIYSFLLTTDYYMAAEYALISNLFKKLVRGKRWSGELALKYYEYLLFEGWEYECIVLRALLLNQDLKSAAEFCLETQLVDNTGISCFRNSAVWRGVDYDDRLLPASHSAWKIKYDKDKNVFVESYSNLNIIDNIKN